MQLRTDINSAYATGGTYTYLSQVGVGFARTGEMTFDEKAFDAAVTNGTGAVQKLFAGSGGEEGAFATLQSHISKYTEAGGLVPDAKDRIDSQLQSIGARIDTLEVRLAVRRDALSKEFLATDSLMTSLNSAVSSLSQLQGQYRLF
jgi:flagellar hook-associated protein 2